MKAQDELKVKDTSAIRSMRLFEIIRISFPEYDVEKGLVLFEETQETNVQ